MPKIAMLFPYAPAYRERIYKLMDDQLDVDWYFCGDAQRPLKMLNYSTLKHCDLSMSEKNFAAGVLHFYKGFNDIDIGKYDVVIIAGVIRCLTECKLMLRCKEGKKPKIFLWTHGWYGKENLIQRLIKILFFKRVSGLFLYGNYARNLLIEEGLDQEKMFVIYNSLDYDKQLDLRNNLHLSDVYRSHFGNSNPVLIMIGRLNLRKKLGLLLEAVAYLAKRGENYNVVLIGDGEDRHSLEQMCAESNLTNQVWFYGACYDEKENATLLYNSDLCIVPGDIGLTAIHSMMFGVPVISHNNFPTQGPEFEAILEGKTGCLFQNDNIESLSNSISKWFSNNRTNRDQIRQNCYNEIDTHWNPMYQLQIIKRALDIQ